MLQNSTQDCTQPSKVHCNSNHTHSLFSSGNANPHKLKHWSEGIPQPRRPFPQPQRSEAGGGEGRGGEVAPDLPSPPPASDLHSHRPPLLSPQPPSPHSRPPLPSPRPLCHSQYLHDSTQYVKSVREPVRTQSTDYPNGFEWCWL